MKIGGWETRAMFERYNIVDQTDMKEALGRYEDMLSSPALETATPASKRVA